MKSIIISSVLIIISVLSCYIYQSNNKFDQVHFIKNSFGVDLSKYLDSYKYSEKNGLLIINDVNKTDPIYIKLMGESSNFENEFIQVTYFGDSIGNHDWGSTNYKKWGSFDQFSKITLYYEKTKILLIGYFDSFGG